MDIEIELDTGQMLMAAIAGCLRFLDALSRNRAQYYGAPPDDNRWETDIEGCIGEYVVSKYLNLHWPGKGSFRGSDVGSAAGGTVEVRQTAHPGGHLLLHDSDDDDKPYWLVTGHYGKYRVRGWIWGREGKKAEYWREGKGRGVGRFSYHVPQSALRSPESFERIPFFTARL